MIDNDPEHTVGKVIKPPAYVDGNELREFEDDSDSVPPVQGMPRSDYPLDWSHTVLTSLQKTNGRCRVCGVSNADVDLHVQFYIPPDNSQSLIDKPGHESQLNDYRNTVVWCGECAGSSCEAYDKTTIKKGTITSLEDLDTLGVSDIEASTYPLDWDEETLAALTESGGVCEECEQSNTESEIYIQQYNDPDLPVGEHTTHARCRSCRLDPQHDHMTNKTIIESGTITSQRDFEELVIDSGSTPSTPSGGVTSDSSKVNETGSVLSGLVSVGKAAGKFIGGGMSIVVGGVAWLFLALSGVIFLHGILRDHSIVTPMVDVAVLGAIGVGLAAIPVTMVYLLILVSGGDSGGEANASSPGPQLAHQHEHDGYVYNALTVHTPNADDVEVVFDE